MKLKAAIIGVGYWSHYVRILSEHSDVELCYVCDLKQENLDKVKAQYPNVKTTTNAEIIYHSDVDCVIIATPVTTHYAITKGCLINNKHCLVEKAFTYNQYDASDLIRHAAGQGLKLAVGHTFLYNSLVQKIKEILDSNGLGEIKYLTFRRIGKSPVRQDVNCMWDLAAHDLSMLRYWFDQSPKTVKAYGKSFLQDGLEDVCFMNMEYSNGMMANIHCSWIDPVRERKVVIVGEEKMLVMDDMKKSLTIFDNDYQQIVNVEYKEPLKEEVNDFIQAIRENRKPLSDGLFGYQVVSDLQRFQKELNKNVSHTVELAHFS